MPAGLLIQGSDPSSTCSSSSKGQEILLTVGPSGFLPQAFCSGKREQPRLTMALHNIQRLAKRPH